MTLAGLFDVSKSIPEFLISYKDHTPEDAVIPEYIRAFAVDDEFLGFGIRINTGVPFTITPDDAIALGDWLINAGLKMKAGEK